MKRSVAGIAIEDNKIFIAKRKAGGALSEKWEFPGGKVEEDESDENALLREFKEELGVEIIVGDLLGQTEFEHKGLNTVYAYYISFKEFANFKLTEHTEWRWACLEEIKQLDFVDSDRKLFPYLQR